MSAVTPLPHRSPTVTVEAAVERFLTQPDLGARTVTAYTAAMARFRGDLGVHRAFADVTAEELRAVGRAPSWSGPSR